MPFHRKERRILIADIAHLKPGETWHPIPDLCLLTQDELDDWARLYSDNYFWGLATIINSRKSHLSFLTQPQLKLS